MNEMPHKADSVPTTIMGDWGPWLGIDPTTKKRTVVAEPVWYRAGDMERAVVFQPGYRTDRQTYGRHGMEITWLLRGPRGVTQFVMFTFWEPGMGSHEQSMHGPMGADLGYHALCPQYEGQDNYARNDCAYLPGGTCYYDGSGLQADELLPVFFIEGEAAIWRTLTERHDDLLIPGEAMRDD